MKKIILCLGFCLLALSLCAQVDRREVRSGNRRFAKEKYREAEVEYRKSLLKDSTSFAGNYNLASTLYREQNYDEAAKLLDASKDAAAYAGKSADLHYNRGDVALQKKDYAQAVKSFRESLLQNPGDLDAKENYIYAKKMLENQQQNQDQNQQQNQDKQDQNKDQQQNQQDQNQQQDQQQNQDRQDQQQSPKDQKISPQQAQQMLKAVQAQEQKTQDKVKKEKAAALQSRQKEKNW